MNSEKTLKWQTSERSSVVTLSVEGACKGKLSVS